jgi:hypothetical protein
MFHNDKGHCHSGPAQSREMTSDPLLQPVNGSSFGLSCGQDETVNILCLPKFYSKFDLPFRTAANLIKIGIIKTNKLNSSQIT